MFTFERCCIVHCVGGKHCFFTGHNICTTHLYVHFVLLAWDGKLKCDLRICRGHSSSCTGKSPMNIWADWKSLFFYTISLIKAASRKARTGGEAVWELHWVCVSILRSAHSAYFIVPALRTLHLQSHSHYSWWCHLITCHSWTGDAVIH